MRASSATSRSASASRSASGKMSEIDDGERRGEHRDRDLHWSTVHFLEDGAQGLMPAYDLRESPLHDGGIHAHIEPQGAVHIIERTARCELIQEPEAFLGIRERRADGWIAARDRCECLRWFGLVLQQTLEQLAPLEGKPG